MRLLFISLEFSSGTFSGNGIYAQSQVRSLSSLGHRVFVLAGAPHGGVDKGSSFGAEELWEVRVPHWGRLDASAPWKEFAAGAAEPALINALRRFRPEVALGVDWSALAAYRALAALLARLSIAACVADGNVSQKNVDAAGTALMCVGANTAASASPVGGTDTGATALQPGPARQWQPAAPPLVYLNYRVFTRTAAPGAELRLIRGLEASAMQEAVQVVALSRSDAQYLARHVAPGTVTPQVLLPALREDVHTLPRPALPAMPANAGVSSRCCANAEATAAAVPRRHRQMHPERLQPSQVPHQQEPAAQHTPTLQTGSLLGLDQVHEPGGGCTGNTLGKCGSSSGELCCAVGAGGQVNHSHLSQEGSHYQAPLSPMALQGTQLDAAELPSRTTLAASVGHAPTCAAATDSLLTAGPGSCGTVNTFSHSRPYLTCCVRLSPEKEPHRFVELVEELARRGALGRLGVTPLMVGTANDDYAQALKHRLRTASPDAVLLEQFLGPADLARVYAATRLNVHSATYDAYGMTIVEAASQGAPSLVHDGDGAVGATDLLRASHGEVLLQDLHVGPAALADHVQELLGDEGLLLCTAHAAMARACSWDESANATALVKLLQAALSEHSST